MKKTYTVNRSFRRGNGKIVNSPTVDLSDDEARPFRISGHISLPKNDEATKASVASPVEEKSSAGTKTKTKKSS